MGQNPKVSVFFFFFFFFFFGGIAEVDFMGLSFWLDMLGIKQEELPLE